MDETNKNQIRNRKCFFITPIGEINSNEYNRKEGLLTAILAPVLEKYSFKEILSADKISESGMINTQIIKHIIEDDLVIADLTGTNPNVMYEVAIRHTTQKPIIHICENGTTLPFDIKDNRTIFYDNSIVGSVSLTEQLNAYLKDIDYEKAYIDNPVYSAYNMAKLLKDPDVTDFQKEMITKIEQIQSEIQDLKCHTEESTQEYPYIKLKELPISAVAAEDILTRQALNKMNRIMKEKQQ